MQLQQILATDGVVSSEIKTILYNWSLKFLIAFLTDALQIADCFLSATQLLYLYLYEGIDPRIVEIVGKPRDNVNIRPQKVQGSPFRFGSLCPFLERLASAKSSCAVTSTRNASELS